MVIKRKICPERAD